MKHLFVLFVAMLATGPLLAQDDSDEPVLTGGETKSRTHAFYVGPRLGITFSTMSQPSQCDLYDGMGVGFGGGATAMLRFGKFSRNDNAGTGRFAVGLELKYKMHSVKTCAENEKGEANANLSMSYFDVPVFVRFYATRSLYIEAGPDFAGTIGRSPKVLSMTDNNNQNVTFHIDSNGSKLKGMDVRAMVGVGLNFKYGLDVNARYYLGTSKLAENFASKINHFEVSVAWLFNAMQF